MKRVIFFAKHMDLGGLEKSLLTLLNHLDHERFQVTLVLEEKRGALLEQLDRRVVVQEYRLSGHPVRPVRRLHNLLKRMVWTLRNRNAYDFSCAYCTYSVIGSRLAQAASRNSCLYVHNDYTVILPQETDFRAFFSELRAERFQSLVFVSKESREAFLRRYALPEERLHVINNLVDAAQIRALASAPCAYTPAPGEITLLFAGRLDETQKRLSRLLEGLRLALERRGDLHLLVVGDGPDRGKYEQMAREYGVEERVTFLGAQTNPYPCFAAADCLVLTSDYEGFPVVYYEAMILGLDIITTIPVSDEQVVIADRAVVVDKDAASVAEALSEYAPRRHAPFDMDGANRNRLSMLTELIDR